MPSLRSASGSTSRSASEGVVFLSGVRTGFGTFGGTLKDLSATELGAAAARAAIERSGVDRTDIGHVVFGNVLQTSSDAIYLARHVGLRAGLPIETPAVTVNRLCGSGFEAVAQAAQQILLGEANAVLAGGTESMSQAPHVVRGARWGLRLGPAAPLEDTLWEALRDPSCGLSMAVGRQWTVTRPAANRARWRRGDRRRTLLRSFPFRFRIGRPGRLRTGPLTNTCGLEQPRKHWRNCRRTSRRTVW